MTTVQSILDRLVLYSDTGLERLRLDVINAKKGQPTATNNDLLNLSVADLKVLQLAINDEQDRRLEDTERTDDK